MPLRRRVLLGLKASLAPVDCLVNNDVPISRRKLIYCILLNKMLLLFLAIAYGSWCGRPLPCDYMKTTPTIITNFSVPIHVMANQTYFYGVESHTFQFDSYLGKSMCQQMFRPLELTVPYPVEWDWVQNKSAWISFNFHDNLSLVYWCVRETSTNMTLTLAPYGIPFEIRIGFNGTWS